MKKAICLEADGFLFTWMEKSYSTTLMVKVMVQNPFPPIPITQVSV